MRAWGPVLALVGCGQPDRDDPWEIVDAIEGARAVPSGEPALRRLNPRWVRKVCVIEEASDRGTRRLWRWYDHAGRPILAWNGGYTVWDRAFEADGEVAHVEVSFAASDWVYDEVYEHGRIVARHTPQFQDAWRWDGDVVEWYSKDDFGSQYTAEATFDADGLPVSGVRSTSDGTETMQWTWNADGTFAREHWAHGPAFSETTWTWSETEGLGQGRWENPFDRTAGSWVARWEREDGHLVAFQYDMSQPGGPPRWIWDGERVVAYEGSGDRYVWSYDADGHVVEQSAVFDQIDPDAIDRWTWNGDRLLTHRSEWTYDSTAHWYERRFGARCPPSAWKRDLPSVNEPAMFTRAIVPGEPYE